MKTENINEFLRHPGNLSADHLPELKQLVSDYPWCQSFQILLAKGLKISDDPTFNKQLKKTAIYATDRKILYRLIMQPGLQKSIADFESLVSTPSPEIPEPEITEPASPPDDETTTVKPSESAPELDSLPDPEEPKEEESPEIDSRNLEQEVLKEVVAHAYQLEFESNIPEPAEEKKAVPEKVVQQPKQIPRSFIDFITGGGIPATTSADESSGDSKTTDEESSLIEKFIKNEPKIERKKSNFFSPVNMGKMSLVDKDEVVSETLAGIYAKQGDIEKAKRAYRQLALKYPEKSLYFAGLIKKLEQSGN